MSRLKHLFQPITMGGIELKNRLVMTPMALGYVEGGAPTKCLQQFLAERAEGGVGLITAAANPSFPNTDRITPCIGEDEFVPHWHELVERVHAYGVPIVAALQRTRKFARSKSEIPVEAAPSPVAILPSATVPRGLDVADIHQIIEEHGEGARRAREAGFDGVEFLAGIGQMISQFISPATNKRQDEYGGNLENRLRIVLEIIECIKKMTGADYAVGVRYSAHEFIDGGYDLNTGKEIARILEKAGVDWLSLQVGWHSSTIPLITKDVPEGHWTYLAEEIKKVVSVPVITAYRIADPLVAERTLAEGKADLIGMARAFIADPEFANKAKEGRFKDIRYCICCCRCIDQAVGREVPLELCNVNPRLGKELDTAIEPARTQKRVFIVGGGPGGMETARVAALRGHKPILYERGSRMGGLMILGSIVNPEVEKMLRYQTNQIKKLGVEVRLRKEVTPALIQQEKPDAVVLSVGGIPVVLKVPGAAGKNVFGLGDARAYLLGHSQRKTGGGIGLLLLRYFYKPSLIRAFLRFNFPFGKRVVIIGGKFAGFELADFLAEKGKQVTVLEESGRIGSDIGPATRFVTMSRAREFGVTLQTNTRLVEITKKGVRGIRVTKEGTTEPFETEADTVIITTDLEENKELAEELEKIVPLVYLIGDAAERQPVSPPDMWGPLQPRRIGEAVKSGYRVALQL